MSISRLQRAEVPNFVEDIELIRELGRGNQCSVYLGVRGDEKFAVKILDLAGSKDSNSKQRFYREAGILGRCNHPNLVKILKVSDPGAQAESTYLIMELLEGDPLSVVLEKGPIPELQVLQYALQIASALREVHRFGLVHRDLKPKNVIINQNDQAKVIDFGLASSEVREESSEIVGTFLYSSPEQTGLLKRAVDQRSDLYSLGIILFECLTGRPPYQSSNSAELMHLHLSSPVPPLDGRAAKLVARLMAKDPDDRYPNASSLIADLQILIEGGTEIGKNDLSESDAESLPIIGREEEVGNLKGKALLAGNGEGQMILIRGESGSGKSRLARELVFECRKNEAATILSTKSSMSNSLPFGPIRELLSEFVRQFNNASQATREGMQARIGEAIGDRLGLLMDFSPAFVKLFGEVQKITHFNQEKFFETLADLVLCLGVPDKLQVIVMDDVQWFDDSSIQVLKHLARKCRNEKTLILMSAREELGGADNVQGLLAEAGGKYFHAVSLKALDVVSTQAMISQCLGGAVVEESLLKNIYTRSNGNAFAVKQFVSAMIDGGILLPSWGSWKLNLEGLEKLKLPSDVIQLLLQRTNDLSEDSKLVLKHAAILSERFDADLLATIVQKPRNVVDRALASADEMKLVETDLEGRLQFVHDKVREAFNSLWTQDDRARTHQAIGDLLFSRGFEDDSELYLIANHYRYGVPNANPERTFAVGFQAAQAAYRNFAYQEALDYFEMSDVVAASRPSLRTADFEEVYGICFMTLGKFLEAEQHLARAIEISKVPLQRARVHCNMIKTSNARGAKQEAWDHANAGFAELNVSPAIKGPRLALQCLIAFVVSEFIDRFIGVFPAEKNPAKRERLKVLAELSDVTGSHAYYDLKAEMMILAAIRSAFWARRLGVSRELSVTYCHYAMLASLFRFKKRVTRYSQKALDVANGLHDPSLIAYAQIMVGNSWLFMAEDELFLEKKYRQIFEYAFKWGEPSRYISATGGLLQRLMRRGQAQKSFELIDLALQKVNSPETTNEMLTYRLGALSLCGRIREASALYSELDEFVRTRASQAFKAMHTLNQAIFLLETKELGERADIFLDEYERSGFKYKGGTGTRSVHIPGLHIRLQQWLIAPPERKSQRFEQLQTMLRNTRKYGGLGLARREPEALVMAHIIFVEGAIARAQGDFVRASKLFDRAESLAVKTDCPWILFEVSKHRAYAFLDQGYPEPANQHLMSALSLAVSQGWAGRANRLRKEHGLDFVGQGNAEMPAISSSTHVAGDDARYSILQKQLNALLSMSVEASKVSGLVPRCRVVLKEMIQLLNPERAFIFLFDKDSGDQTLQIGQDYSGNELTDISNYSSSIIEKVRSQRKPIVVTGSDQGGDLTSESIVAYDLRSIMSAPLLIEGEMIGVVYLDSRVAKGIFKEKDVQLLMAFGDHIAVAIESARAAQLELKKNNLQKDLEVAGVVQTLLLPKENTAEFRGLKAVSYFQPAEQVGGDWWCYEQMDDGKFRVLLGDVTGHGAGSAMLTAVIGSCFHTTKDLMGKIEIPKLAEILNRTLIHFCNGAYWMTFSAIEIDPAAGTLNWWNMGSPPLLKAGPNGHELIKSESSSPLGSGELTIAHLTRDFKPGDQVMIFSDGLFEFTNPKGRDFGLKSLVKLHREASGIESIDERVKFVESRVKEFRGTVQPPDDITFSIIQFQDDAGEKKA